MACVALATSAGAAQQLRASDPLGDLERWTARLGRNGRRVEAEDVSQARSLAAAARRTALEQERLRPRAAGALLDLALAGPAARPAARGVVVDPGVADLDPTTLVRAVGREELRGLLLGESGLPTAAWLASDVLARAASEPPARRAAAAEALEGLHLAPTRLALFAGALDEDLLVRRACQRALVGWDDDGVHRFLLDQAARGRDELGWIEPRLVRRHFADVRLALTSPVAARVLGLVREGLGSEDWRRCVRTLELGRCLPDGMAVPPLIDALRDWQARRQAGKGRLRVEADLAAELRRRSGRNIGPHPERWATWWRSRVAGASSGGGEAPEGDGASRTSAGFFGLRPMTDRVVFVLDRSGSMDAVFSASERTRYEEAVLQLCALLESLGPQARYRVILFSSGLRISSAELREADEGQIASTRAWMLYRDPEGGTQLEPAVREALRLDREQRPDLTELDADTVIVLCDGQTAEGPGWVEALLEGPNQEACVVFHCVQIGGGGDGTLEALAQGTGGTFVTVPD